MQRLLNLGFLDGEYSIFDYGCGRGDDVRLLQQMGIVASGWDPVFNPQETRSCADVVNLGFVLNVIENERERNETLKMAFSLARKILSVSVMLGHRSKRERFVSHGDGFRTKRSTFQKFFAQNEFIEYIEATLNTNAIPVAPGICLVFRDSIEEQLFRLARQHVKREWTLDYRNPNFDGTAQLADRNRPIIDTYWRKTLELGRHPEPEECPEARALIQFTGSWRGVFNWVSGLFGSEELKIAANCRQQDLLVYFALSLFERKKAYGDLPEQLQQDVRSFFGSITKARDAGRRALFATGNDSLIERAAVYCHEELKIGRLFERHNLTFHQSLLNQCTPLIRIYVGCALQLFGDANSVDLVKVHLQSRKVSFLIYDDIEGCDSPRLIERIKVDLSSLRVDFFDYVAFEEPQFLEGDISDYLQHD